MENIYLYIQKIFINFGNELCKKMPYKTYSFDKKKPIKSD